MEFFGDKSRGGVRGGANRAFISLYVLQGCKIIVNLSRIQMGRCYGRSEEQRQLSWYVLLFATSGGPFALILIPLAGHSVMGSANIRSFQNAKPNALWWTGGQTTSDVHFIRFL
jgi:hypothetical protein